MLPICYNGFVRSARFFLLPAVALAEEGALPPMLARHVVPLTPLVSVRPIHSVSSKQCADESPQIPFFVFKNLRTLSFSVSCNSFTCHYYEDCWVCTNNSHSGTQYLTGFTRGLTQVLYFHILPDSFALSQSSTLFFSCTSGLFGKNIRGWEE